MFNSPNLLTAIKLFQPKRAPPFQLIKRGWGEFPIHVQIHFKDPRNKRLDISHLLKLDWTQTGLQTFGGETTQDCQLLIKQSDFIQVTNNDPTSPTAKPFLNSPPPPATTANPSDLMDRSNELESPVAVMPPWADIENNNSQFESTDSQPLTSLVQSYVKPRRSVSPSHFISTVLPETPSPGDSSTDPRASFDDLMLNFCSLNELSNKQTPKQTVQEMSQTENDTEISNIKSNYFNYGYTNN